MRHRAVGLAYVQRAVIEDWGTPHNDRAPLMREAMRLILEKLPADCPTVALVKCVDDRTRRHVTVAGDGRAVRGYLATADADIDWDRVMASADVVAEELFAEMVEAGPGMFPVEMVGWPEEWLGEDSGGARIEPIV